MEIVGLDAALKVKDLKPEEAEKSLADYLAGDPDNITIAMMRCRSWPIRSNAPRKLRKF